jgi:hypothetical protein
VFDPAVAKDVDGKLLKDYPAAKDVVGYYAFEGELLVADDGPQRADPRSVRDDDLLTAWRCTLGSREQPCVLSLRFSEPIEIGLLRIAGPARTPGARPGEPERPKRLRIHTGRGWVEVKLANSSEHQHISFRPPIPAAAISLEITESYGEPARPTGIAELDLFGQKGPRHAPLVMDPNRLIVRAQSPFFRHAPDDESVPDFAAPAWIEELDHGNTTRRLFRGSAIHTLPGDRLAGVSIRHSYSCPGAIHYAYDTHFVVDTSTRLSVSLGESGMGSHWLREKLGQGVAVSSLSSEDDSAVYNWLRLMPNRRLKDGIAKPCYNGRCPALKTFSDFRPPAPRGCHAVTKGELTRLRDSSGKRMEAHERESFLGSGRWLVCAGPEGYDVWVVDRGKCEEGGARVLVVDRRSTIVEQSLGGDTGVRRLEDDRLLIGIDNGDTGEILTVEPAGKLRRLFRHAAFAISAPSGCWCSA